MASQVSSSRRSRRQQRHQTPAEAALGIGQPLAQPHQPRSRGLGPLERRRGRLLDQQVVGHRDVRRARGRDDVRGTRWRGGSARRRRRPLVSSPANRPIATTAMPMIRYSHSPMRPSNQPAPERRCVRVGLPGLGVSQGWFDVTQTNTHAPQPGMNQPSRTAHPQVEHSGAMLARALAGNRAETGLARLGGLGVHGRLGGRVVLTGRRHDVTGLGLDGRQRLRSAPHQST